MKTEYRFKSARWWRMKAPKRGCFVLDQSQPTGDFKRGEVVPWSCSLSSTRPGSFFGQALCKLTLAFLLVAWVSSHAADMPPRALFEKLLAGQTQTVVVYGTSLSHTAEWPKAMKEYFDRQFPGQVNFINSASSGKNSDWGLANLQKRVLPHHPDLVFIEFSMNDAVTQYNISQEKAAANLDMMVKALRRQNPRVEIVLQTMNTVWDTTNNPGKTAFRDRPNYEKYYESYRAYARANGLPLVDHEPNWKKLQREEPETFKRWLPDGTHPIPEASLAVTWPTIEALLEKARHQVANLEQVGTPKVRVARFLGDRAAAISYTFDDGLRDQYTLAVPMLNEVGFKGTFFVIPGKVSKTVEDAERRKNDNRAWGTIAWNELREMAGQGHEIASHTWSHPNLTKLTAPEVDGQLKKAYDAIKAEIGRPPLTLAYPFNAHTPEIETNALKYYIACRDHQIGVGGSRSTVDSLNYWVDEQVREHNWGVVMAHAIGSGYAAFTDPEIFRVHLQYVKTQEANIWVDTFANVSRYEQERDDAKLDILTNSPLRMTLTLIGTLDPAVYDVPLTLVLVVHDANSAHAERAGRKLPVRIASKTIQVDAAPSNDPITITWTRTSVSRSANLESATANSNQ